jgi:hypothetical protein
MALQNSSAPFREARGDSSPRSPLSKNLTIRFRKSYHAGSAPRHADPEEAYRAFLDLGARTMIPMHWGCFDLTDEPVDLAPKVLAEVLDRTGADRSRVLTMALGERWRIPAG